MVKIGEGLKVKITKKPFSEYTNKTKLGSITLNLPGINEGGKIKLVLVSDPERECPCTSKSISWFELLDAFFTGLTESGYNVNSGSPDILADILHKHSKKEWIVKS